MLLDRNNTSINLACQQYTCNEYRINENKSELVLEFVSLQNTKDAFCMHCGSDNVYVHDNNKITLRDMPIWCGIKQFANVSFHRYRCNECGRTFNEDIGFKLPETRITNRAAQWIKSLLSHGLTISAVSELTSIHWDTIRKIHTSVMEDSLSSRIKQLKDQCYKPKYLAVDEFAIHKGHT